MKAIFLTLTLAVCASAQTLMPLPAPVLQSNLVTHIAIDQVQFPSKLVDPHGPVRIAASWSINKDAKIGESMARGEVRYYFDIVIPQSNVVAQIQANTLNPPTGPITNVLQALDLTSTSQEGAVVMLGLESGTKLVQALQASD